MFRTRTLSRPFTKVLVANRGEIACRVFKTAQEMGINTVAVYCDAEKNGKHVQLADESFRIGPPPASNSYLKGDNIIEVAKNCGAQAIHPGYGFLSENAEFANAVANAGLEFIGPPSSAIVAMGSKSESKNIMTAANVPVVPGYHGEDQSIETLRAKAKEVGFPLLIKAVSGGGGKGMKIVRKEEDFDEMLNSAKREATNFFKDDRVLLERFIERPRHVELQVFCDKHGNGVFCFERDCSVQRRYQKVLEEAPAPGFTEELRNKMGDVAVRAAKAVNYVGAGTVEFIFDTETDDFYFMEMNTRLQVEHPVTEEVSFINGKPIDLVRLQIETAEGKPLPFTQADLALTGSCIEARIFAESPRAGFLPGSGHLKFVSEPKEGVYNDVKVRVDTGFRSGDDVLVHYDPMIAKLIVWGPTRERALKGLRRALDDYQIVGIETNIEFLKKCCDNEQFARGGVTTKFIEENSTELLAAPVESSVATALAAVAHLRGNGGVQQGAMRLNHSLTATVPFGTKEQSNPVQVSFIEGQYHVNGAEWSHVVSPCPARRDDHLAAHVDNAQRVEYRIVHDSESVNVLWAKGVEKRSLLPLPLGFGDVKYDAAAGDKTVFAPMPGKVSKFLVPQGSPVKTGQNILVVEAMKMEHMVKAPKDGFANFCVVEGHMASSNQRVATIEEKM